MVVDGEDSNCRATSVHDWAPRSSFCLRREGPPPGRVPTCGVGDACRKPQFQFCSCIEFDPHRELSSHNLGAFPHTGQAVMSLTTLLRKHRWVNALSVVPHSQTELLIVIADFDFDLSRLGVAKRVP